MLVCNTCGYALYRSSTKTSKRKLYYYRCIGSDNYRFSTGRVCNSKPIRQDYLDSLVWDQVVALFENPDLIQKEINRRLVKIQNSDPTKRRKECVAKEISRQRKSIEKLLDAYQEDLLQLEELRKRMPSLRKREEALKSELSSLEAGDVDQHDFLQLVKSMEGFLGRLLNTAKELDVIERQKILRLVVKEVLVDKDTIRIKHSIPITGPNRPDCSKEGQNVPSYPLRKWSQWPALWNSQGSCKATAFNHHASPEVFTDKFKHTFIFYPT